MGDTPDLAAAPHIRCFVGVAAAGQPMVQTRLEAGLMQRAIDRIEVELGS
jgi:hypothetical protein